MDGDRDYCLAPPEEVLATLTREGKRRWLYPKVVKGRWFKPRAAIASLLVVIFIVVPFIRIGGEPFLLIDIISRKLFLFGKIFYATDTAILLLFGLSVVVTIMTFTAYLGRVWCGWICPQTVYLEFVYRPIERWIEGSPAQMQRRDLGPLTLDKVARKTLKYLIFIVISFVLANAFLAYFVGTDRLLHWITLSPTEHPESFGLVVFVTGLMMFDFCYFREQMCSIACPYARLQSALLDKNSAIVSYDSTRGEPRGKGRDREGKGDCVDCGLCHDVCPTGIDIRKGLQLECIHCTQCIDACDSIMEKVGKPAGLIRYATKAEFAGEKVRVIRPRTALYTVVLIGLLAGFTVLSTGRTEFEAQVLRDRGAPYTVLQTGEVSNYLRVALRNKSAAAVKFTVSGSAPSEAKFVLPESEFVLGQGESKTINVFVTLPANSSATSGFLVVTAGAEYRHELTFPVSLPK